MREKRDEEGMAGCDIAPARESSEGHCRRRRPAGNEERVPSRNGRRGEMAREGTDWRVLKDEREKKGMRYCSGM